MLMVALVLSGCGEQAGKGKKTLIPSEDLGPTIGSLAEVISPKNIPVEGFGLVGGLNGTGSAECPTEISAYLKRYILTQLPKYDIDVEKLISSDETAVVRVDGLMPTAAVKNQSFDVRVTAMRGTQTTSLEGGWLYSTELKLAGSFGVTTRVLASAKGPVFIDTIDSSGADKKTGFVLGGGTVRGEYKVVLMLPRQDYTLAALIRNRLNERYGFGTARAIAPDQIEVSVPARYATQKDRFVSLLKATYLTENPQIIAERVKTFIRTLALSDDKFNSEIALEAIGNESLSKLSTLLKSSNEEVRLRAGRCMLNIGSNDALPVLRDMALKPASSYRIEALQAIARAAARNDAVVISRRLLRDDDFTIRLAAYEQLRKLDDISITQEFIGRNFFLDQVPQIKHKAIFVYRCGKPRIVLFGAPLYCRSKTFVQSADGSITIDAPANQKYVTLIRRHPKRPSVVLHLRSGFELGDIIRKLCEEPAVNPQRKQAGLGVSYADMIALLKQMCDKGAVTAEFHVGPLPKIG